MHRFSIFLALAIMILALSTHSTEGFVGIQHPSSFSGRLIERASSSTLQMTVLTYGAKKKNFKPGTPLSTAVQQLGVKPRYSCKKGDCATCEIFLAGRLTKPCVAKVPPEPKLKSLQEKGLEIRM